MSPLLLALALLAADRSPQWHGDARPSAAPQRIVSFAPAITDVLIELDAGKHVVGVTRFCDARGIDALPRVGGYVDISLELVLSLKPDLVIAMPSMGQRGVLDRLRDRNVPVLVVFGDSLREMRDMIRAIGDATSEVDRARAIDAQFAAKLDAFAKNATALRGKKTAVVVGTDPIVVAGPGTFIHELIVAGGATPATPPHAPLWPQWSIESLATSGAQLLITAEGDGSAKRLGALIESSLPVERRPRIVHAPTAILMRPGPRLLQDIDALTTVLAGSP